MKNCITLLLGTRWLGALAVLIALAFPSGYVWWMVSARHLAQNGGLVAAGDLLDLGEVWVQRDLQWKLRIRNPSRRDVRVDNLESSCNCTWMEPRAFVVPAGGCVDVSLVVDLSPRTNEESVTELRQFAAGIIPIIHGSGVRQPGWALHGKVRSPFPLPIAWMDFAGSDELIRGTPGVAKSMLIKPYKRMSRLTARCDPSFGEVLIRPRGESLDEFELRVIPNSAALSPTFEFDVLLGAVTADGRELPATFSVRIRGSVAWHVQVSPSTLQLGAHQLGSVEEAALSVQSRLGLSISVTEASTKSQSLKVEPYTSPMLASSHTFHIRKQFTREGPDADEIRFFVRDELGETTTLAVPVRGYGMKSPADRR